jgi:hypothetical protein
MQEYLLCGFFLHPPEKRHLQVTAILNPPSELNLNRLVLVLN